jgi:hypothetical protein
MHPNTVRQGNARRPNDPPRVHENGPVEAVTRGDLAIYEEVGEEAAAGGVEGVEAVGALGGAELERALEGGLVQDGF